MVGFGDVSSTKYNISLKHSGWGNLMEEIVPCKRDIVVILIIVCDKPKANALN